MKWNGRTEGNASEADRIDSKTEGNGGGADEKHDNDYNDEIW